MRWTGGSVRVGCPVRADSSPLAPSRLRLSPSPAPPKVTVTRVSGSGHGHGHGHASRVLHSAAASSSRNSSGTPSSKKRRLNDNDSETSSLVGGAVTRARISQLASASGRVTVDEVDLEGKYVRLSNKADEVTGSVRPARGRVGAAELTPCGPFPPCRTNRWATGS